MLTQQAVNMKDWFTHLELNVFLGCELTTQKAIIDRWMRSPFPIRIAFRGSPNLYNGLLEQPEVLYRIDDVIASLRRDEIPFQEKYQHISAIRDGDPYEGGLQEPQEPLYEEIVAWLCQEMGVKEIAPHGGLQEFLAGGFEVPDGEAAWVRLTGENTYQREKAREKWVKVREKYLDLLPNPTTNPTSKPL